ncbi:hypothetical protein D3C87_587380 [compost metagenome]
MTIISSAQHNDIPSVFFAVHRDFFLLIKQGVLAAFIVADKNRGDRYRIGLSPNIESPMLTGELLTGFSNALGKQVVREQCAIMPGSSYDDYFEEENPGKITISSLYDMSIVDVSDNELWVEIKGFQVPLSKNDLSCMDLQ